MKTESAKKDQNQLSFVWNGERRLTYKELLVFFHKWPEFKDRLAISESLISLIKEESIRDLFPYKKRFATKLQLDQLIGFKYYMLMSENWRGHITDEEPVRNKFGINMFKGKIDGIPIIYSKHERFVKALSDQIDELEMKMFN